MARKQTTNTVVEETPQVEATNAVIQKQTVLVANQHTGAVILPRVNVVGDQRIAMPPLILHPGTVTPVDGEEWAERKKMAVIQHYLDNRLLAEVSTDGGVSIMSAESTNLENALPDNLKTEQELNGLAANVRRENVGNVNI